MERFAEEIAEHYDREIDEGQRLSRGVGRLELLRTREIVRRHLPQGRLRILDVGGGAGVHAAWLAEDGHEVHLVEPVARHVEQARRLTPRHGRITAELGDARALPAGEASFDAVLLLGPLYHAAISRFASLFDGLSREFLFDPAFRPIVERDLREGQHRNPERRAHWFTTAYFHHPDELRAEIESARLEVIELLGVEGLATWLPQLGERWDSEADRELILWSARVVESEPSLLGLSAHLLAVARPEGPADRAAGGT